jgi:hypothetical protein
MKKCLIRIPLQFFGEDPEDYEDFEEDEAGAEEGEAGEELDDELDDEGEDSGEDAPEEQDTQSEMLAELRKMGYVGDDLATLLADMKAKNEAKAKADKAKKRKEALANSKNHVKGSKPRQGANGEGTGGVTEHRVADLSRRIGCTPERARALAQKHAKLIGG